MAWRAPAESDSLDLAFISRFRAIEVRENRTARGFNARYRLNLGAAENEIGLPTAVDDFRRALDGDGNDPIYLFNLGAALLKNNSFAEASQRLQAVLERNPDDKEARGLLDRAQRRETTAAGAKSPAPERLKQNFDEIAFRQLKAMLQPKGS